MPHKLAHREYRAIANCFEKGDIYSQADIRELTGLPQPVVSIGLEVLEADRVITCSELDWEFHQNKAGEARKMYMGL